MTSTPTVTVEFHTTPTDDAFRFELHEFDGRRLTVLSFGLTQAEWEYNDSLFCQAVGAPLYYSPDGEMPETRRTFAEWNTVLEQLPAERRRAILIWMSGVTNRPLGDGNGIEHYIDAAAAMDLTTVDHQRVRVY